ncbi:MAG: hypothetical protein KAJ79_06405 [Candidatus Omnitrophica bacterium]|nr:hypothetical protein [Candidatus Omnitrophota bacterium]MCK5288680.1 hypothetical protein [Candidatus Omnitrophota bacterium]
MKKIIIFFPIILLLSSPLSFSAIIHLKNGNTINAEIIQKTDEYIKVEKYGMPITYYFDNIEKISYVREDASEDIFIFYIKKTSEYISKEDFVSARKKLKEYSESNSPRFEIQILLKALNNLDNGIISKKYIYSSFTGIDNMLNKKNTQALENFKAASEMNPDYPLAYYFLGVNYIGLSNYIQAKENFTKAEQIFLKTGTPQAKQEIANFIETIPE